MKNTVRALIIGLCVGSPVAFAQPAGSPAAPAKSADPVKAPEPVAPVKLVDAGAEPRRLLRYAPTKDDTFGFEMRMKMSMSMTMEGKAMPSSPMPTMVSAGDVRVLEVMPDGNMKLRFTYGEGKVEETEGVMPQVVTAMEGPIAKLKGISGEFVFTNRGEAVSGSFVIPEGTDPMVKQTLESMNKSMQQLTVPLPAEAVGKGAKWTCERVQDGSGIKIKAVYTQEITALTDKGFTSKVSVNGDAGEQAIQGVKLDSMKMTGNGEQRMDLVRMMPVDSRLSSNVDSTMSVPGQGKVSMTMVMTMSMKQTEAGAAKPAAKPDTAKPDDGKPTQKF